jgi:hypothetical protein
MRCEHYLNFFIARRNLFHALRRGSSDVSLVEVASENWFRPEKFFYQISMTQSHAAAPI